MNRLWPRSLLGQVMLAVALALLAGQAISAALLFRASEQRRIDAVAQTLGYRLSVAQAMADGRLADDPRLLPPRSGGVRAARPEFSATRPTLPGDVADPDLASLVGVLVGRPVTVVSHPAIADPAFQRRMERGQLNGRWREQRRGQMIVASMPLTDGRWASVRAMAPDRAKTALRGLLLQTGVLFVALLLAIWLLLRRITRPLAALTARVEQFARTRDPAGQLALQGPDDIRRLIAAHNAMEARIAAMIEEKDVMLGAIGHDLKTPLAALRVRIEGVDDEAERGRMAAGIEDITRTLDDILSLARVGRASEPPERTELSALAAGVVEECEDLGQPAVLGETVRLALPLHVIWAKRALRNLISNAVRYGGGARVSVLREGGEAVLRVTDDGPGIPESRLLAMTEPFTRGEASRNRETGGAGIGLTLARAIAEQHGGRLVLVNRLGGGLCAEIRLPLPA